MPTLPDTESKKSKAQGPTGATQESTELLHISSSPHIRDTQTVPSMMKWVIIALIPAFVSSLVFFSWRAVIITVVSVLAAVGTEWAINKYFKRPETITDFSAALTGLLLAFNLPSSIPWWMPVVGSVFAIAVAKLAFGGLGSNFINPALAGRAFLIANYPAAMTNFAPPNFGTLSGGLDAISAATPLGVIKDSLANGTFDPSMYGETISALFLGNVGGSLGETSALALLIGGFILVWKKIIDFRIPLFYIGTVFLLFWISNGSGYSHFSSQAMVLPLIHVLGGGLMLGAIFMATDMVTSPITSKGRIIFAVGCGFLTFIIRKFGGYPEGVTYSILLMNLTVPLIDRYTRPTIYGEVKKGD
ncbi:Electron transport complex protein RnfD [Chitinispirillum alkaliphilum]|nr:Electron transport complex protein RnfD [Chitinispirillum alkaliphilum]